MRHILAIMLALFLSLPAPAMPQSEAVDTVVNHLRMRLQQSERYEAWDAMWADWWTVYDLRPYEGFFEQS